MALANRAKDMLIVALVLVIMGQTYTLATRETVVTINPPPSAKPFAVGSASASPRYQQLWAVFLAELVGNITPENAPRVRESVGPFLAPSIRNKVMQAINADIEQLRQDDVVTTFAVDEVHHDLKGKGRVYVVGESTLSGMTNESSRGTRTYVIKVEVVRYQPRITYFNSHAGKPEGA